jgi:hypothetical protein
MGTQRGSKGVPSQGSFAVVNWSTRRRLDKGDRTWGSDGKVGEVGTMGGGVGNPAAVGWRCRCSSRASARASKGIWPVGWARFDAGPDCRSRSVPFN